MKKSRALADALTAAGLLIDSSEIAQVVELLQEDTELLRGDCLNAAESARLTASGPAALIAEGLRKTIRACFPSDAPWPLNTAKEINSARYWYDRYQHGECLIDALALAHYAASYGLDELDMWRLRARLEQLSSMALFALPEAPPSQALAEALHLHRQALARKGGQGSGESRRAAVCERDSAICAAGKALLEKGRLGREITGIVAGRAEGKGLSQKQIRAILRKGGVLPPGKKGE